MSTCNLFLFTGEETFMLYEQVRLWKEAFRKKHGGDMNLAVISGAGTEIGDIIAQIGTAPFLGDKRLVFVEGLPEATSSKSSDADSEEKKENARDQGLRKLADFLDSVPESSVVVFVQPAPDKRKYLYKKIVQLSESRPEPKATLKLFNPLTGSTLTRWMDGRAKYCGTSIDARTADYLVSLTGQSLWRVDQELKKLSAYADGGPITREAIDRLTVPTIEANVFHLTDALGAKDHKKAIQNLHRSLSAGENLRQVFYMIVRQFRLLLQVGGYLANFPNTSPANIASSLKIHPFVARSTIGQLSRFSAEELKNAYASLLEIDSALKTSGIRVTADDQDELALAIERFVVEFCG